MRKVSQKPGLLSVLYSLPQILAAVVLASASLKPFYLLPEGAGTNG